MRATLRYEYVYFSGSCLQTFNDSGGVFCFVPFFSTTHFILQTIFFRYSFIMNYVERKNQLIHLVRLSPGLWKQPRKARGLKQKLWDEVGAQLGTTGFDAKRQWEILRDQLRRETKRLKQNPDYKSTWAFYSKMQFTILPNDGSSLAGSDDGLEPYHPDSDFENNSINSIKAKTEEEPIIQVRKDLHDKDYSFKENTQSVTQLEATTEPQATISIEYYQHPSTSAAGVSSSSSSTQKRRRLNDNEMPKIKNNRYPNCEEDDEDYYFAMSIVPAMRCIQSPKKLRLRSKILNLIAAAMESEVDGDVESNYGMSLLRDDDIEEDTVKTEPEFIPEDMVQTSIQQQSEGYFS
ncbi:uncharacterized protein LOC129919293 [Episyrphus balteatus]|uniref:uncharacterized protein LOC129919293 n=1 Tax=Episyrphus balteatus TaxID=286459 RepID=UPI002486B3EF|nr:uncharacterized protein LOC129919293 [Episyrphus balteatus]